MKKLGKFLIYGFLITNFSFAIGRIDVVGYTYSDWQWNGPPFTNCVCDSYIGIYVSWGSGTAPNYTDRNIGYNVYEFTVGDWAWPNGINTFVQPSGFGGMDVDLVTGNVVLSTNQTISSNLTPVLAQEFLVGTGVFSYSVGPTGYRSPPIAITNNQAIHCVMFSSATYDSLYYTRVQPWAIWSTPINISSPNPADYPDHNINGSKLSNKIVVTWDAINDSSKYYRQSLDGGQSWRASVLLIPPAFSPGSETVPASWLGSFGFYDRNDNLHIVTQVSTYYSVWPAEIWHYCPTNNPVWTKVHRAEAVNISAPIGYNGVAACRPSLAQNPITGTLYCVWEQFDSLNYEPSTYLLRADIWMSESHDNGLTWVNNRRITTPNTTSKRFPIAAGTVWRDTLWVRYIIDSIAGFAVVEQGRATRNPVVAHWVPVPSGFAIEEQSTHNPPKADIMLNASPNPFSTHTAIRFSLSANNNTLLEIFDVTGRLVKTFNAVSGQRTAVSEFVWNGQDNQGKTVKNGVYFCALKMDNKTITRKIIKTK